MEVRGSTLDPLCLVFFVIRFPVLTSFLNLKEMQHLNSDDGLMLTRTEEMS